MKTNLIFDSNSSKLIESRLELWDDIMKKLIKYLMFKTCDFEILS